MNDSLYILFDAIKKSCLHCAYVKAFNPNASEDYKIKVVNELEHISKWETPNGLNILQTNLVDNCRTFASEALTKCGSGCLNGVPEVAKYLEEKIMALEVPDIN